ICLSSSASRSSSSGTMGRSARRLGSPADMRASILALTPAWADADAPADAAALADADALAEAEALSDAEAEALADAAALAAALRAPLAPSAPRRFGTYRPAPGWSMSSPSASSMALIAISMAMIAASFIRSRRLGKWGMLDVFEPIAPSAEAV